MSKRAKDDNPEIATLRRDNESLRAQLEEFRESHETMRAIREGQVDALVVSAPEGDRIFTLQGAEQPYRLLIEQMQEAAIMLGQDGTIEYANRAFAEMLQRPLEQVIGSVLKDHVVAADQPAMAALLVQGHGRIDVAIQAANETRIPVQASASVVGPHKTVCLVVADLTEHKRAEQRLRATFDNAASGIAEIGEADRLIAVNDRLCRMLGYTREQLLGKSVQELTYPADRPRSDELIAQVREGGLAEFQHEKRYVKKDGSLLWAHVAISAVRDEAGRYLYTVGTIVDISARKAAEARVRLHATALEAAPNAISISETDRQGTIVWVNRAFTTLTGYSAEEAIGHSHHLLSSGRQDEAFYRNLWQTVERGEMWRGELINRRKDGTLYQEEMGITPLRDEEGRVTHFVAIKQDITARKQAESALRESERQLRFVCESIPHLVWAARPDGDIDYVNQRVLDYTGARHEELTGWGWLPFVHPEDRQRTIAYWQNALQEGSEVRLNFRLRHGQTGQYRWHAVHALPLRDAEGRIIRWYGTCTDIDEQKRAEEALRQSEARLTLAQEAARIGAFQWDVQTGVNLWTPQLEAMYGLAPGEFGKTESAWEQLVHPEDRAAAVGRVNLALETGQPVEGEWRVIWPDGSVHWLMGRFQAAKDTEGKPLQLSGVNIDITERKRAEETLRESEQRLRLAQQAARVGTFDWDLQADHDVWTPELEALYGLQPGEFAKTGKAWADLVHPEDRAKAWQLSEQSIGTGEPATGEWRVIWPDGSVHWLAGRWQVFKDPSGKLLRMIGVNIDITARKQAEKALRESEDRLRAFLDNSAVIAWLKDEDGRHIFLSQNYEKRFNARLADWKGKTDFELWPREVAEEFRRNDQAVLASGGSMEVVERATMSDGSDTWWLSNKFVFRDSSGRRYIGGLAVDITERKQTETNRHLLTEILRVLNRGGDLHGVIRQTLRLIHEATGFDAIGLRLRQGEDYPYFEHNGFSEEFLHEENFLCQGCGKGAIVRDAEGRPMLECTCGLVLSGRTDPKMPCFTEGGSFWSNVSSELLALPREVDPRTNPRNRCIHQGYQSVGLFPVRAGAETIGLLQLNDRREGRFTPGQIAFWESVAQNIGLALQRETAEEALRQSETQFHDLAEAMPQLVWIARPDGYHEYFNAGCQNYLGTGFDQLAGTGWTNCLHPDDRQRAMARWDQSLRTGEPYEIEYRLKRASDGAYHWFLARALPVRDEQGRITRWFGTCTDIEEQKQAEERLEQRVLQRTVDLAKALTEAEQGRATLAERTAALRESEQRLNLAQQAARIGAFEWNVQTDVNVWTPGLEAMYGLAPGEFGKTEVAWEQLVHPEDHADVLERVQQALETGEPAEKEWRVIWPDSSVHWIMGRFQAFKDAEGKPLRLTGVNIDITERKRAEEALRELNATLEQRVAERTEALRIAKAEAERANAAKDHFLAVLSHELRTPLTPVLPALEELARHVSGETREDIVMAHRNVELEARLIDDLLDVTRISQGKVELHRENVDLCTVMRRAAEVCASDIEARRLHFGIKVEGGPYAVEGDPARLQQVFWNLIKNAIKFTPHGGCVGIHCQGLDGHVVTEVKDSGMGIEPEALARIFNAFEQVDRSVTQQFGGLGLGLAICKALVELHGGTITAKSDGKGKGAIFTVTLPILKATTGAMPLPTPGHRATGAAAAPARPMHILLVEDHGDTARILCRLLRAKGHRVETAGDVATALELAEEQPFDLLLSDLGLPDGSGVELIRQLREHGRTLRGIALSGYGQDEDIRRSKEAGFREHLTKPVNLGQLEAAIGRIADE